MTYAVLTPPTNRSRPTTPERNADFRIASATAQVAALDLAPVMRSLAEKNPDTWTAPRLAEAERDYRRFLTLQLLYPGTTLIPSRLIDAVWHRHILDTRKYHADCLALFGRYLHHNPHDGTGGEEEQRMQRAFRRTNELWATAFGDLPPGYTREWCSDCCTAGGGGS